MAKVVSRRTATPSPGGLGALANTAAVTIWGNGFRNSTPDPLDPNGRWDGPAGYGIDPHSCDGGWRLCPSCGEQVVIVFNDETGECEMVPLKPGPPHMCEIPPQHAFAIATTAGCSIMDGFATAEEAQAQFSADAERALQLFRWDLVGAELACGDITEAAVTAGKYDTANMYLSNDDTTGDPCGFELLNAGVETPLDEALWEAEDYLSSVTGVSVGIIHVDRKTRNRLKKHNLIYPEAGGTRWRTCDGHYVLTERYYRGKGPKSLGYPPATPTSSWMYPTGPLEIRFGTPKLVPGLDEAAAQAMAATDQGEFLNKLEFRVEQTVGVIWQCAHGGINVNPCPSNCC